MNVPISGHIDPNTQSIIPNERMERKGKVLESFNPRIQGPLFERAGNSFVYSPEFDSTSKLSQKSLLGVIL